MVPEFPPDTIGGGGTVFESLARTLAARGHRVRVLTSRTHGGREDDRSYPFPIKRVPQLRHFTPQFKTYMPPSPFRLSGVRAFLAGTDVYHLHGYGMAFIDAIFNFFTPARRAVFTTHGFPYTVRQRGHPLAPAYAAYDSLFGSRILKRSARATAVSAQLAREAQLASGRAVRVIPNGLTPLRAATNIAPRIGNELAKGPYLLAAGRLEPLKGFQYAIEALAIVRAHGLDVRLFIAGSDTGDEARLREVAARLGMDSRVSFLGAVERAQLAHLYAHAACAVVSSEYESFSLVTLEAMSCGAPVAAAAVGGIPDIVRDGENGLLFPPADVGALADCVERILLRPALREKFVAKGRATIERFTWDAVAAQYEEEYEAVSRA